MLASGCLSGPTPANGSDGAVNDGAVSDASVNDASVNDASVNDARILPTCDDGPVSVHQISAGKDHTCVVLSNGLVHCWGIGGNGRLGYGHSNNVGDETGPNAGATPATEGPVDLGEECAVQVAAGTRHTCALMSTGNVRCWGRNVSGGIGIPPPDDALSPTGDVPFTFLSGETILQVAAGGGFTCVRLDDGNVRCFGQNDRGQLGHGGAISLQNSLDTNVPIGGFATHIEAGNGHVCVRFNDGTAKCWGAGDNGKLGYNGTGDEASPSSTAISIGAGASDISAGAEHTCAVLTTTGFVRCWGLGEFGRLGNLNETTIGDNELPSSVTALDDLGTPVSKIAAGGFHTCALIGGKVRCWGTGVSGALGYADGPDDVGDDKSNPLRGDLNTGIDPIRDVVTGGEHTCALSESGKVRCWGRFDGGRLGYGDGRAVGDNGRPITGAPDVPVWCDGVGIPCS